MWTPTWNPQDPWELFPSHKWMAWVSSPSNWCMGVSIRDADQSLLLMPVLSHLLTDPPIDQVGINYTMDMFYLCDQDMDRQNSLFELHSRIIQHSKYSCLVLVDNWSQLQPCQTCRSLKMSNWTQPELPWPAWLRTHTGNIPFLFFQSQKTLIFCLQVFLLTLNIVTLFDL